MAAIQIRKEKLLIVEGKDEESVFGQLLVELGITDVQIIECGGNIQFKTNFPALTKSPGFADVSSYAIVQDGDANPRGALDRVQGVLKKCEQPVPASAETFVDKHGVRVGIYILPGAGVPGMLEDLYLATLQGTPVLGCVDRCVEEMLVACPPTNEKGAFGVPEIRMAKVRALGTLMATSGPHNRLGLAAKDGYWNLKHPAMDSFVAFVRQL